MNEEQAAWVGDDINREIVEKREPVPCGESVTTTWIENGEVFRQDVEIIVAPGAVAG